MTAYTQPRWQAPRFHKARHKIAERYKSTFYGDATILGNGRTFRQAGHTHSGTRPKLGCEQCRRKQVEHNAAERRARREQD